MSAAIVMVTGTLQGRPELKTAKTGAPYVVASVKTTNGDKRDWFRVRAFNERVQGVLLNLDEGDGLTVCGPMEINVYKTASGEVKAGVSLIAEGILTMRDGIRQRGDRQASQAPATAAGGVS